MRNKVAMTKTWWLGVLNDPVRLAKWLQKLQITEIGGHDDHFEFMSKNAVPERETKILTQIALDEQKHSSILVTLMNERGIPLKTKGDEGTVSYYWTEMNKRVVTFNDYCGVNYYGEALAAERFEIIRSIPETPSDIKAFIDAALPDEIFHRETLMRLAGDETMAKLKEAHDTTFDQLVKASKQ